MRGKTVAESTACLSLKQLTTSYITTIHNPQPPQSELLSAILRLFFGNKSSESHIFWMITAEVGHFHAETKHLPDHPFIIPGSSQMCKICAWSLFTQNKNYKKAEHFAYLESRRSRYSSIEQNGFHLGSTFRRSGDKPSSPVQKKE